MRRLIVFRYHDHKDMCEERIRLLKRQNPETPIYGLGEPLDEQQDLLEAGLEHMHFIEDKEPRWKWLNGDLALMDWFQNVGRYVEFDVLHLVEWDILFTKPLSEIEPFCREKSVILTGIIPMDVAARRYDWSWATGRQAHAEELLRRVTSEIDRCESEADGYACIFPGASFCRDFLEDYDQIIDRIPPVSNDEWRVGMLSSMLGYSVVDTGFFDWEDPRNPEFNCMNIETKPKHIQGTERDAFHPYRGQISQVQDYIE